MMFTFGVILFALGIGLSIALHEYGHFLTAKSFGMKVRRYFIGFGPTVFSWRRTETEYGLKAIPAGGFCDIAGMTALDELEPDEHDRAMYKQSTWKRLVVMLGGPMGNFVFCFVLVVVLAVGWGLPNLMLSSSAVVGQTTCVAPSQAAPAVNEEGNLVPGELAECTGVGPAEAAGVQADDIITAVNGEKVENFGDLVRLVQPETSRVVLTVERGEEVLTIPVGVERVQRYVVQEGQGPDEAREATVGAIGVGVGRVPDPVQYGLIGAIPASASFMGDFVIVTWDAMLRIPERMPAVVRSIIGEDRDPDTPISVVGASRIGGEVAERGLWEVFILLLAGLNLFIGLFNLLPLLPLDGGHIAVTIYESIRNRIRRLLGRPNGPPVDYTKLLPITFTVILIGGAVMLLTITADIVNPIRLF
ncbi:site-2 protease family protein [Hoyosella rhizosphaerae]|uniref:Zinc metalloprotease Rip1 n=1 Tax=Hoyosella rhizosphaerae TaxID=1755582 RepID=A0A916U4Z6_9ACTN|nr:site-2 protease family protein [Hoyosella rhizosphaerae]MBN4926263.1 site-2 protease family protein [Hoyosella rhizosphaerae]GGC60786.1 zinc metalloprotease [Hoyosella rhizosphaerae]